MGSGKRCRVGILKACLGKRYVSGLPRNASGVSRGSAKCMDLNSGFAHRRSEGPVTSSVPPPAAFLLQGGLRAGEGIGNRELGSGKWEVGSVRRSRVGTFRACLGKRYVAGLPRNASGVSRGSAMCMDGNSGMPVTRGL